MKSDKRDLKLVKKSLVKVVDCVSKNTAVTTYNIINKEYVVFIGTVDNPELFLHMYVIKIKGDKALCAVLNNEVRWCEFDYKDRDEFEMIVASNVIKSIEETKKLVRENKMI